MRPDVNLVEALQINEIIESTETENDQTEKLSTNNDGIPMCVVNKILYNNKNKIKR